MADGLAGLLTNIWRDLNAPPPKRPSGSWQSSQGGTVMTNLAGPMGPQGARDPFGPMGPMYGPVANPYGPQGPQGPSDMRAAGPEPAQPQYGPADYLSSLIDQINQQYDQQVGQVTAQRDQARSGIQGAYDFARSNVQRTNDMFAQSNNAQQQAIAQRLAEMLASQTGLTNEMMQSAQSMGRDTSALQALGQANVDTLRNSNNYAQDFTNRLAQIVGNSQANTMNNMDLVRQGATGNLENRFSELLSALMVNRDNKISDARGQAYASSQKSSSSDEVDMKKVAQGVGYELLLQELASGKPDQYKVQMASLLTGADPTGLFDYLNQDAEQ